MKTKNSLLGVAFLVFPVILSAEVIKADEPGCSRSFDGGKKAEATRPVVIPQADEASQTAQEVKIKAQAALSAAVRLKGVLNGLVTVNRTPCCIGGARGSKRDDCKTIVSEELVNNESLIKERLVAFGAAVDELVANAGAVINGVLKYRRLTSRSPNDVDLGGMTSALDKVASGYRTLQEKAKNPKATRVGVLLGDEMTSETVTVEGETPRMVMTRKGLSVRSIVNLEQVNYLKTSLEKLASTDLSKAEELAPIPAPRPYRGPHSHFGEDCHLFIGGRCVPWPAY